MKYQRRAALISLAIHGVVIAAMTGIAAFTVPAAPTLTIDFSIKESPVPPPAAPVSPPPKPTPRQTRKPAPPPVVEEEVAFPDTTMENTAVDTAQFTDSEHGEMNDLPALVTSIGPSALPQDTGHIRENERQRYLKEQFEYIRNIIYRKAAYPSTALEMNITGTVFLSFCVREDGGVESIDILKGSGASILDRDAVSTIKRAAPFPRPPIRVTVKFPLEYRLE
jgi:periplasmic protein TonB